MRYDGSRKPALTLGLVFICLLVEGTHASYSYPRPEILGTDRVVPMTGINLRIERVGVSDTLTFNTVVQSDSPLKTGHWEVSLPGGLTLLSGELQGTSLSPGEPMNDTRSRALVRVEGTGNFQIAMHAYAAQDSANWSSMDYNQFVRVTPDSFIVIEPIVWESFRRRVVVDGIHYGICMLDAVPLDPEEDEQVVSVQPFDGLLATPPVILKHSATRSAASGAGATVEIPIRVAVDRSGRVKSAGVSGLHRRTPTPDEQAALEAAWKWRFSPTMSKGRPVTALYLIRVPVKVSGGK